MSFGYYKKFTSDHTQCGSADSTNFPITVFKTDADFATVANGGKAQNSNGYDIRPYSDSGLTTALTFELVTYNATTGQIEMHVKVGTLSHSSDLDSYMAIGDNTISTDGSSSSTWESNYKAVYHLKDGTTLSLTDSTSNANNGTNHSLTATTGQINGGVANTGTAWGDLGTGSSLNITGDLSFTTWLRPTSLNGPNIIWGGYDPGNSNRGFGIGFSILSDDGKFAYWSPNHGSWVVSTSDNSINTIYFRAFTLSSTTGTFYLNGSTDGTASTNPPSSNVSAKTLDNRQASDSLGMVGWLDEVRLYSGVLSTSYLLAQYNNQKSSSTFLTWGSLIPVSSFLPRLTLLGVG